MEIHANKNRKFSIKAAVQLAGGQVECGRASKKLRQWLVDNNMSTIELGRRTGISTRTIRTHVFNKLGYYTVTLRIAFAIEWVTKGHVQAWEWLDHPVAYAQSRHLQSKWASREVRQMVLYFTAGGQLQGVPSKVRARARCLARHFGVDYAEARKRAGAIGRDLAKLKHANTDHLYEQTTTDSALTEAEAKAFAEAAVEGSAPGSGG